MSVYVCVIEGPEHLNFRFHGARGGRGVEREGMGGGGGMPKLLYLWTVHSTIYSGYLWVWVGGQRRHTDVLHVSTGDCLQHITF